MSDWRMTVFGSSWKFSFDYFEKDVNFTNIDHISQQEDVAAPFSPFSIPFSTLISCYVDIK